MGLLYDSFLRIPTVLTNLTVLKCSQTGDGFYMDIYSDIKCFEGSHLFLFILGILNLIIFLLHNFYVITFLYETNKESGAVFARRPSNGIFNLVFAVVLGIFGILLTSETYDYLMLTFSLFGAIFLWMQNVYKNPYHNS